MKPLKLSLPRRPAETFRFLSFIWDVDAAKALVADREPNGTVPVANMLQLVGVIRIDELHLATGDVDLSQPLIAVPLPSGGHLVIDGWHRATKAERAGIERLPAHVLSAAEERQIRLRGSGPGED